MPSNGVHWHVNAECIVLFLSSLLRMCQGVWAIFCHNWLITLLFHNHKAICLCNWQSTAKNRCAATCIRATVTPNRSLFGKPPGTSLTPSIPSACYTWTGPILYPRLLMWEGNICSIEWKSEEIKLVHVVLSQAQFNKTFQKSWAIPTLIGHGLMQVI